MTREEIIKEIIRLGNLLLEEKKENAVEDDYEKKLEDDSDNLSEYEKPTNQCSAKNRGNHCHKLIGHYGQHHDILMGVYWG